MYPVQVNNNHAEDGVLYGLQGTNFYKEIEKSEAMTREDTAGKSDNKIEPFDEFAGLTDFERTLADICIGWIGKEIGWEQYIKDHANILLRIVRNNLLKSADDNELPEIDREVIVLLSNNKVCFAHRPQEYWDGKNIATGEITRYYPKRYDKGNWNIPDVKWWLDLDLPKMKE